MHTQTQIPHVPNAAASLTSAVVVPEVRGFRLGCVAVAPPPPRPSHVHVARVSACGVAVALCRPCVMAGMAGCDFSGDRLTASTAACVSAARASAAPAVFQMGPLDGTWLARLVAGMLVWEGAFRCVRLLAARPATAPAAAAALSREDRDLWRVLVPSYTVSTLHALLMCWCAPRRHGSARRGAKTRVTQFWRPGAARSIWCSCGARQRRRRCSSSQGPSSTRRTKLWS